MKQEKEIKGIEWEGRNTIIFVHRQYDHLCRKSRRIDKKNLLIIISDYKVVEHKGNIQKSITFYIPAMNKEFKIKN